VKITFGRQPSHAVPVLYLLPLALRVPNALL